MTESTDTLLAKIGDHWCKVGSPLDLRTLIHACLPPDSIDAAIRRDIELRFKHGYQVTLEDYIPVIDRVVDGRSGLIESILMAELSGRGNGSVQLKCSYGRRYPSEVRKVHLIYGTIARTLKFGSTTKQEHDDEPPNT